MKKEVLDFHARFCRVFSNTKRLEIFWLLQDGEMTVSEIINKLAVPKASISQHLTLMHLMGILEIRRNGLNIYYRMANKKIIQACSFMQNALEHLTEGVSMNSRQKIVAVLEGDKKNDKNNKKRIHNVLS